MTRLPSVLAACLVLAGTFALGGVLAGERLVALPTEVAVLSGTIADGQSIPLPDFADGTPAAESECRWMVSPSAMTFTELGHSTNTIETVCRTEGRVVRCYTRRDGSTTVTGTANYLVIATRPAEVSAGVPEEGGSGGRISPTSLGKVKSSFGQ